MRFYIVFFFTSFICSCVHAQSWRVLDSLCYEYGESNPDSAIIYGKKAIEGCIKEKGKNSLEYAVCLDHIASAYKNKLNFKLSDSLYHHSIQIIEKIKLTETKQYANVINNIGSLYYLQNQFSQAEELFIRAKDITYRISGKYSVDYVSSCNNLASVYYVQGRYTDALELFNQNKEILEKTTGKMHHEYAQCCNNLGLIYKQLGNFSEAEKLYKEVLEIKLNLSEKHTIYALTCDNLGGLYFAQSMYNKAEILFKEAKRTRQKILGNNNPDYATSCNNLGVLYMTQGKYQEAEKLFTEAKQIYYQIAGKTHRDYLTACNNLATLYYTEQKYEKAESLYVQLKEIYSKILGKKHSHYAIVCNNLGNVYQKMQRFTNAELNIEEAKRIRADIVGTKHPDYAQSCNNLASVYFEQKKYEQAKSLYKQSMKIYQDNFGDFNPNYVITCTNLTFLYQTDNKLDSAEILYKQIIIPAKIRELENNIIVLSDVEKEKYIQVNINPFFNSFFHWTSKGYGQPELKEHAFNLIIKNKGLIIQSGEKIKNRILNSGDENLKKMYLEWKKRKDDYVKAQNLTIEQRKQKGINLDSLANQINELEKELSLRSEDFANTFTPKTVTWKDIQNALKKDQAAIEIVQVNAKQKPNDKDSIIYMALIVKKNSEYPEIVVLPNGNDLESKYITNYRRSIQSKIPDELSYNAFWKPIKEKLKGIKTVYFSPDGIYHQINLNTLQNPETKKYVSDEIQVINVTNTKDILNKRTYTTKNSYLIGNPKFDLQLKTEENNEKPKQERTFEGFFEGVSQLEGAEKEVKQISAVLPNAKTTVGTEATEEYVKSIKNPRILHIATHGYFKKGQYQSSTQAMLNAGLLFAGVIDYDRMEIRPLDKEDGKLTAFEVMNMELDSTELVVLSACETGLGQASKEGVYGLQRAFKVAGAQSIIMSLWKVNDEATQLLMTKFYENWQKKGMDKRKAFETAQKEIRKQYKEPYYWGAFVMIE